MTDDAIDKAANELRHAWDKHHNDVDFKGAADARDQVLARFQPLFATDHIDHLTAHDFQEFLADSNNRHWSGLERWGSRICVDMERFRHALRTLLDEARPIRDRINDIVGRDARLNVPGFGPAFITPVLLVAHPDRYGVWNRRSTEGLKRIFPGFDPDAFSGERYEYFNEILKRLADALHTDLWTLDLLWWKITADDTSGSETAAEIQSGQATGAAALAFRLEQHLHDFLFKNWEQVPLFQDWALHVEEGEVVGYKYPCEVGEIDLLAKHKNERRWLVIELKRDRTGDSTLGQLQRYIGWIKRHLAQPDERVEGLIIAQALDKKLRYAVEPVADFVKLKTYKVDFQLIEPPPL